MNLSKTMLGVGVAGLMAVSTLVPASAAPAFSNPAMVKSTSDAPVPDVRWRAGPAVAAGVLGGLALGGIAAATNPYYDDYSYGPAYGAYPAYGPYAYSAPRYYGRSSGHDRLHNDVGNF